MDYGVAESSAGNENAVRIMSIHKSKGLEFPIVFVSGLSKKFNKQDVKERIVMHPELGLGTDAIDPEKRIKFPTLSKKMIQKQIELESLGEELRVLYVALTRAREKLIMTGTLKNASQEILNLAREKELCERGRYESLCSGSCFLDWILEVSAGEQTPFEINCVTIESLVEEKISQTLMEKYNYALLRSGHEDTPQTLVEKFTFEYPYEHQRYIPGKVSVSELKKAAMEEDVREMFEEPEIVPYIPAFLREERKVSATERGTAYHRVAECMNLSGVRHSKQVEERIEQLVLQGKMTQTAADTINPYDIYVFCQSELCRRLIGAEQKRKLYKEQPFVFAKAAKEVYPEYDSEQEILVQGIMDAYFEENDEIVLIDYKTDHVKTEEELVKRYKKQLEIYAESLEQMTGKKVKERILYSFCLGKEIFV